MAVCLFGLGQTGSRLAAALLALGVDVFAFDPAVVETPLGAVRASHPALAVARAEVVVATVPSAWAELALLQCLEAIPTGSVYADASPASPVAKLALAELANRQEVPFADLYLLSDGPRRGVATGSGSQALAQRFSAFGYQVDASDGPVGSGRMQRPIERVALAGFGVILSELLAATPGDERQYLLRQISDALDTDREHWAMDLMEQVLEPLGDLATEAAAVAAYLRQQGTSPVAIEALAQHLFGALDVQAWAPDSHNKQMRR